MDKVTSEIDLDAVMGLVLALSTPMLESLHAEVGIILETRFEEDQERAIASALALLERHRLTIDDLARSQDRAEQEKDAGGNVSAGAQVLKLQ